MAAFSQTTFNATRYLSARPAYPSKVYQVLKKYHFECFGGAPSTSTPTVAIDLGCGPGTATHALARFPFDTSIGYDPSERMIETAKNSFNDISRLVTDPKAQSGNVEFRQGTAEESLMTLPEESVDFIGAGQAAHWFDYDGELYDILARVLKKRGTVAFWGYGEMFIPGHTELSKMITHYSGTTLRDYWQQPGRSKTEALLQPIPFPLANGQWNETSFLRVQCPSPNESRSNPHNILIPNNEEGQKVLPPSHLYLEEEWTARNLLEYLRTWSSATVYNQEHKLEGNDGVEMSLYDEFVKEFGSEKKFKVQWPMGFIMFKKAA